MKTFAKVAWTAGDVMTLAPHFTEAEAERWLAENESSIQDQLISKGWEALESLLGCASEGDDDR